METLREDAAKHKPKGKTVSMSHLFDVAKDSAKVNDLDNPAWTEDMLGAPVFKRGFSVQKPEEPNEK